MFFELVLFEVDRAIGKGPVLDLQVVNPILWVGSSKTEHMVQTEAVIPV